MGTDAHIIPFSDQLTELSVLATGIVRRTALVDLLSLDEDDFCTIQGKAIFAGIRDLAGAGETIDLVALRNRIIASGRFESIGGDAFYAEFAGMETVLNHDNAIKVLRNHANRRKLWLAADAARQDLAKTTDVDTIVTSLRDTLRGLADPREHWDTFATLATDGVKSFADADNYIQTGISEIDRKILGLFTQELLVVAARPGIGKSSLALQVAVNAARHHRVLFISLEMPSRQLALKMVSMATRIDSQLIRKGELSPGEVQKIQAAFPRLSALAITMVENAMTLPQVESRIMKFMERSPARLVVLDYIQLVTVQGVKNKARYEQIGDVSRTMKRIAKEYDCSVLALAQLNRSAENAVPELSDLRESGDIEQDADVIMFIHDPNKRDAKFADGGPVKVFIAKNRNGRVGSCDLYFNKQHSEFATLDTSHDDPEWGM